ncbi:MAG: hypothetical protein SCK29_06890 [Bacillota bacterium]|nr:hypothetical protein [Bacillota bacterium]
MKKTVCIFSDYSQAKDISDQLLNHDIADFTLAELSADYEQQIRQVIFVSHHEAVYTLFGAVVGAILFGTLFYWAVQNHSFGYLYARLLAGTIRAAVFTGAGLGIAIGGLLSGVYSLSMPLPQNFTGNYLMILYTDGLEQFHNAREILRDGNALFL